MQYVQSTRFSSERPNKLFRNFSVALGVHRSTLIEIEINRFENPRTFLPKDQPRARPADPDDISASCPTHRPVATVAVVLSPKASFPRLIIFARAHTTAHYIIIIIITLGTVLLCIVVLSRT